MELIWARILLPLSLMEGIARITRGCPALQSLVNWNETFTVDSPGNSFEAQSFAEWVSFRAHPWYGFLPLGTCFAERLSPVIVCDGGTGSAKGSFKIWKNFV